MEFPLGGLSLELPADLPLAVGLVFATIVCVALRRMAHSRDDARCRLRPWRDCFAAGRRCCHAVLKNLRVPKRLSAVLEGESLVNDASGLVAYQFAVAAVVTGSFSLVDAGADFVWMSAVAPFWAADGHGCCPIASPLSDPAVEITLTILTPYIAYLPAEKFGFSGVLAVVAAGLYVGHRSWEALGPESRLQRETIWRLLDFLLNSVVFILIGLQFPSIIGGMKIPVGQMIFIGAAISFVVIAVRFLWVFPMASLERYFFRRGDKDYLSLGGLVVVSWAGMRGVVSLAAALALPLTTASGEALPHRHIILFITFCVIFVTLVLQGLSLPWLVRRLKVEQTDSDFQTEGEARMVLLEDLIFRIDGFIKIEEKQEYRESLERLRDHYQDRLKALRQRLALPREVNRYVVIKDRDLLPKLMNYARRRLARMRRRGIISEEIRRRIERDFDMEEERLQRLLARLDRQ